MRKSSGKEASNAIAAAGLGGGTMAKALHPAFQKKFTAIPLLRRYSMLPVSCLP